MTDWKNIAKKLAIIAEKAAPLVGLDDELEAGKALVGAIKDAADAIGGDAGETQAELQQRLDVLFDKVDAHASSTIGKLGDGS